MKTTGALLLLGAMAGTTTGFMPTAIPSRRSLSVTMRAEVGSGPTPHHTHTHTHVTYACIPPLPIRVDQPPSLTEPTSQKQQDAASSSRSWSQVAAAVPRKLLAPMALAFATWQSAAGLRLHAPGTGMPLGTSMAAL